MNPVLTPDTSVGIARSPFTFQTQTQVNEGQRWLLSFTVASYKRAEAAAWLAVLTALNGREGSFLFGDPYETTPLGVATGTPLVKGGSQTGDELDTDGWTAGVTGILKAGDWIGLGSGASSRLHRVLADVDSDGSGNATIPIWPMLRESPSDNDPVVTDGPKGVFRLTKNQPDFARNFKRYPITVDAEEVLP